LAAGLSSWNGAAPASPSKIPGRRFRAALRIALTQREAAERGGAYRRRSQTGHQGTLHGAEASFGRGEASYVHLMPGLNFEYVRLQQISTASRRVVTKALQTAADVRSRRTRTLWAHSAPRCR